jgi:hypothetical protein
MKKNLTISFVFLWSLIFFSCKKDHVCVCGSKTNGVATTFHDTASKAKKNCNALEEEFKTGCELE